MQLSCTAGAVTHTENSTSLYIQYLCLDALPQILRDAIAVTKSISVPYLWVDALCIIQDSDDDKSHEMSMMERVYRDSLVTIVAANSEDTLRILHSPISSL